MWHAHVLPHPELSLDTTPHLELLKGGEALDFDRHLESSRDLFDSYFELRDEAAQVNKVNGEELAAIQAHTTAWIEQSGFLDLPTDTEGKAEYYNTYSEQKVRAKLIGLIDFLSQNYGDRISPEELDATREFVYSAFAMYEHWPEYGEVAADADGSFAFIVPLRMGRNHPEYGEESEPVIPALRYVPNEMRAQMMVGLPPFVIDTYKYDEYGRRGYLVYAPVNEDMMTDLPLKEGLEAAHTHVNEAVDFAYRRFGVPIVGLGATLPSLTKYGQKIKNKHVVTTTGHGGTTELINMTVESAMQDKDPESIGVLGLGAIGVSIADIVAHRFPKTQINIYDQNPGKIVQAQKNTAEQGRLTVSESDTALIKESQIIISAIVGGIDLKAKGISSMEDKIVIDDSQPSSFNPAEVSQLGGAVLWVVGQDSKKTIATRRGYDYGTLMDPYTDVFGCEAETAVISRYMDELKERGLNDGVAGRIIDKVALRSAVTTQQARYVGALFKKYGITAAQPQAFGESVSLPK